MKLWHLDSPVRLHVRSATYVNVKEADLIYVRVGVFHGTEALCQVKKTRPVSHSNPHWNEELEFDNLFNLDLPRAAKLCASICAVRKAAAPQQQATGRAGRSGKQPEQSTSEEHTMLCWGNLTLFDWRGRLATGRVALNLWPVPRDMDDLLNPLGLTGSNPTRDSPCLEVELEVQEREVVYPDMDDFREYASFAEGLVKRPKPAGACVLPLQTLYYSSLRPQC